MSLETAAVVSTTMTWLQLAVQIATVITLLYTLGRFMNKPNMTQNSRLDALEAWKNSVDARLRNGNQHFDQIDEGNRVTQTAILALIEHAINGNDIDKLKRAKDDLNDYLIGTKHG